VTGWPEVSLADVSAKPQYGAVAKGSAAPIGPLFVRQTDISGGRIDWTSVPYCDLSPSDFDRYAIHPGDLLISRLGNGVGNAATVRDSTPAVFAGYLVRFQPRRELAVPEFVGYQLQSRAWRQHVSGFRSGAAQPTLNAQQMGQFRFCLPSLEEQQRIVKTLAVLDDKIEANRAAVSHLEELGSALLEAELELDGYGFPEYDSERRLGDVLAILETGSRPKGGVTASAAGVVSLGAESIQSAGVITTSQFKRVPIEFAAKMKRGHLQDDDVLVYKDGGKPGNFVPHISAFGYGFPVDEATINEHVYRVRATPEISQGLLYWLLRAPWMDQEMRKRGTGVAIPGLNSSNFRDLPWPVLSKSTIDALNTELAPMLAAVLHLGAENERLATLRDAILPELLAGRIRVPELQEASL
jgi:type I restriction enzyme S subunit